MAADFCSHKIACRFKQKDLLAKLILRPAQLRSAFTLQSVNANMSHALGLVTVWIIILEILRK